ncbi:hypothetical protein VTN96DRAFT_4226 [Rasamsonia emersonii]
MIDPACPRVEPRTAVCAPASRCGIHIAGESRVRDSGACFVAGTERTQSMDKRSTAESSTSSTVGESGVLTAASEWRQRQARDLREPSRQPTPQPLKQTIRLSLLDFHSTSALSNAHGSYHYTHGMQCRSRDARSLGSTCYQDP